MRFLIKTLGCRTNIAESEALLTELVARGHACVEDDPDLIVINSCTVTAKADRKTRQAIHTLQHKFPRAKLVLIGCAVRNRDLKWEVETYDTYQALLAEIKASSCGKILKSPLKTRIHLKIQEGCNNHCTYCIIPQVRGPERSLPLPEILKEINEIEERGIQEVVLTGTHIAHWGQDFEKQSSLAELIRTILESSKINLLRLSSLEPQDFSQDLLEVFGNERVCPYIHLALQSGSDAILKAMGRNYCAGDVVEIVKSLRSKSPQLFIGADVITAFPGEGDSEFQETYDFCQQMKFSKLHVFPYSERPGTLAADFAKRPDNKTAKIRAQKLRELSENLSENYYKTFINKDLLLVFESVQDGMTKGTSSNFLRVFLPEKKEALVGSTLKVRIEKWDAEKKCLMGRILD